MKKQKNTLEEAVKPTLAEMLIPIIGCTNYIERISNYTKEIKKDIGPKKILEIENAYTRNVILKLGPSHSLIVSGLFFSAGYLLTR